MIPKLGEWKHGNETPLRKILIEAPLAATLVNGRQIVVGQISELGSICDHCEDPDLNVGVQRYAKIRWVDE